MQAAAAATVFSGKMSLSSPPAAFACVRAQRNPVAADSQSLADVTGAIATASSSVKWAQKTVIIPPQRRGCHLVTSKVIIRSISLGDEEKEEKEEEGDKVSCMLSSEVRYMVNELTYIRENLKQNFVDVDGAQLEVLCHLGLCEVKLQAILEKVRAAKSRDQLVATDVIAAKLGKEMAAILERSAGETA
ncbi:hypothetical protein AXF42_Ash010543 [Apostasia shenzhenica]|uniref:Uncharacterized protein n=1 Tax=Apostasia shenzhenica TaxID=1088818 RepID=A0A2I0A6D5_9ASPA|nr:hypothetical protein AXF42_Ash010543 [Apostasia shenzhenica]